MKLNNWGSKILTKRFIWQEERPRHPPKILKTDVINNPFPDIEPRVSEEKKPVKEESKSAMKGTK